MSNITRNRYLRTLTYFNGAVGKRELPAMVYSHWENITPPSASFVTLLKNTQINKIIRIRDLLLHLTTDANVANRSTQLVMNTNDSRIGNQPYWYHTCGDVPASYEIFMNFKPGYPRFQISGRDTHNPIPEFMYFGEELKYRVVNAQAADELDITIRHHIINAPVEEK